MTYAISWFVMCSVVCPCQLFCSALMCCFEEVYRCLQLLCVKVVNVYLGPFEVLCCVYLWSKVYLL